LICEDKKIKEQKSGRHQPVSIALVKVTLARDGHVSDGAMRKRVVVERHRRGHRGKHVVMHLPVLVSPFEQTSRKAVIRADAEPGVDKGPDFRRSHFHGPG
jgi:hypothetical protein